MIRGIHHTAISTGNLNRMLAFYRDLLGFSVLFESGWPAGTERADRITGLAELASPCRDAAHRQRQHRAVRVRLAGTAPRRF